MGESWTNKMKESKKVGTKRGGKRCKVPYLPRSTLGPRPLSGHESVVNRHANDVIDAFRLDLVRISNVTRKMGLWAAGSECCILYLCSFIYVFVYLHAFICKQMQGISIVDRKISVFGNIVEIQERDRFKNVITNREIKYLQKK